MHFELDTSRCDGFGFCADAAPTLIRLNDDGQVVRLKLELTEADRTQAEAAVRTVIVGASLAGVTAATTLRSLGDTGDITLLGKVEPQSLMLQPLPADLVLRQGRAVALDRAARTALSDWQT